MSTFTSDDVFNFLTSKSTTQQTDATHTSFKGCDRYARGTGKWSIPPDGYGSLFRSIEYLWQEACNDHKKEFAYIIERKQEVHRLVQDIDIMGNLAEEWCMILVQELGRVLGEVYPQHNLECVVFPSSGYSLKHKAYRTSIHVCWNIGVDKDRSLGIYHKMLSAFEGAREGKIPELGRVLSELDPKNTWASVLDEHAHRIGTGMRMPYCDKWNKEGKQAERRPKVPKGLFASIDGKLTQTVAKEALSVVAWLERGSLNTIQELTEPCVLREPPAIAHRKRQQGQCPIADDSECLPRNRDPQGNGAYWRQQRYSHPGHCQVPCFPLVPFR